MRSHPDAGGLGPLGGADVSDVMSAWDAVVAAIPDRPVVVHGERELSAADADRVVGALGAALVARGVRPGDRVGIRLQNVPQFPLLLLALWRIAAVAVPLNPMYTRRELRHIAVEADLVGVVCETSARTEIQEQLAATSVGWVVGTSETSFAVEATPPEDDELAWLARRHLGEPWPDGRPGPATVAMLTFTSGTTGPPKGAISTHGTIAAAARSYAECLRLDAEDVVLATAPFFHITGAVLNAVVSLMRGCRLVLIGRFEPERALAAMADHGVTTTVGSITAFNAIARLPSADRRHFATMRALYSGGAPVSAAVVDRFERRFGVYIHNIYGMTETSSAVIGVPLGTRAPVDPDGGALSIGRPLADVEVRVVDADGSPVAPGRPGELEIRGPHVMPGYWRNPDETAHAVHEGWLRTGDGAVRDADGWIYLIDRLKDQINTSGYKVWPREVEDVLQQHPSVDEAAVVGLPDEYRGEVVVAYVTTARGQRVDVDRLAAHCRTSLAGYKVPRRVLVVDELPKTQSGKVRRSVLRGLDERAGAASEDTAPGGR